MSGDGASRRRLRLSPLEVRHEEAMAALLTARSRVYYLQMVISGLQGVLALLPPETATEAERVGES